MPVLWCCPHDPGHCDSSPDSFDECRLGARWLPTLKPSRLTWSVSPLAGQCRPQLPSPCIVIVQLESCYSFYRPSESGKLSRPVVRVCSQCPVLYVAVTIFLQRPFRLLNKPIAHSLICSIMGLGENTSTVVAWICKDFEGSKTSRSAS